MSHCRPNLPSARRDERARSPSLLLPAPAARLWRRRVISRLFCIFILCCFDFCILCLDRSELSDWSVHGGRGGRERHEAERGTRMRWGIGAWGGTATFTLAFSQHALFAERKKNKTRTREFGSLHCCIALPLMLWHADQTCWPCGPGCQMAIQSHTLPPSSCLLLSPLALAQRARLRRPAAVPASVATFHRVRSSRAVAGRVRLC